MRSPEPLPEQLQNILRNLQALGPRKLAALAAAAVLTLAVVGVGSLYLNRPSYETLYVGLDRSDVNQIGIALGEAGIDFDVGSDGTTVLVPVGKTSQARMLLAEKGLPTSANAGYELFDNVGSLGLTSFMQQVTKVRALEGEIARTIQSIAGIKAARVHIVMAERANFRREAQKPSASVMIRTGGLDAARSANSIRHLVAAAVPGLNAEDVTILDSSGTLLASGDDPSNSSANRSIGVELTVENQIVDNIHRALAPYLGADNFRASVKADVNTDTRQTEETIFDPASRVERSVQVVRSNDSATQQSPADPATVEQNLPQEDVAAGPGAQSQENRERREETTNYELNSKKIATVSNGYTLGRLSISVVVNRARIAAVIGENATAEQIADRIAQIEKVVVTATGFDEARGDKLNVAAVEFLADGEDGSATEPSVLDQLSTHAGTAINAAAFIVVAFLVVWFGMRPLARSITAQPALPGADALDQMPIALPMGETPAQIAAYAANDATGSDTQGGSEGGSIDDLRRKIRPAPQDRLARMVELNEERTAQILRKWSSREAAA